MKKLFFLAAILLATGVLAQSPQAFNYQAIARDVNGDALTNASVSVAMQIRQGSTVGPMVFGETHTPTTNDHGLFNLEVGNGSVFIGSIAGIDWSAGPYFLEVLLDPNGGSAYVNMGVQQLLSVPYALFAGSATGGGNTLDAAYDQGGAGQGRTINADAGEVDIKSPTPSGIALRLTNSAGGAGMIAQSIDPTNSFSTVQCETNSTSTMASAVIGNTTGAAWGVSGQVDPAATAESAVYGSNLRTNGGHGVLGIGYNGVVGQTNYSMGNAIYGENADVVGPIGNGIGVAGKGYWGVIGEDRYLGGQPGAYGVYSNGDLGASGIKSFMIDHPAYPESRFLRHFSTESNEVLNVYRGNVVFDQNGEAVVEMPDYYESINKDPSYQLTPIGAPMTLYIKDELSEGNFTIAGGAPGGKASWTVQAQRNDPYLQQHPEKRAVILEKREGQQGRYFMPQLYGAGEDQKMIGNMKTVQQQLNMK